ncbi:hypothetical protein PG988_006550 [Apiospora saccharicola]|jgi:hypothetical protein
MHDRLADHQPGLLEHSQELRKNWNAATGELNLRLIASALVHDVFQELIWRTIHNPLCRHADEDAQWQPWVDAIIRSGHSGVQKKMDKKDRAANRAPFIEKLSDCQLQYGAERHPHFIYEIGYSQTKKSLLEKKSKYFSKLPG